MRPSRGRLRGVDGIRAIAASSILVWHTYIYASEQGAPDFGWFSRYLASHLQLGVWVFFCLSAFLLYRPFAAAVLEQRSQPDVRRYLRGRVLRIVPVYWAILVFVTLVAGAATYRAAGGGLGLHVPSLIAGMLFVHSYHPSTVITGIAPTWSLSVEVVFYLVLPLLGLLAVVLARAARTHRGRLAAVLAPALLLLVLGAAGRELGRQLFFDPADPAGFRGTWFAVWERSFLAQCDLFAAGLVLAVLKVEQDAGRLRLPAHWRAGVLLAGGALAVPMISMVAEGQLAYHRFATLISFAIACFVAAVVLATRERDRLVGLLDWRPIRWSGEISYSIFLWHYPVIVFMRDHEIVAERIGAEGEGGFFVNLAIVAAATWALSAVTFHFVERPFMARKPRWRAEPSPAGTAAQAPAAP